MGTDKIISGILSIINDTESRVNNIFEPSSILTASYREEGYMKIMSIIEEAADIK